MTRVDEFSPSMEKASNIPDISLQAPSQNLASLTRAAGKDEPVLIPYDVQLNAGQFQTLFCDSGIPDYWLITVRPVTGVKVSVFMSVANSGIPLRLTGGGKLKLPGTSEYLTIACETGSTAGVITCMAIRGYPNVDIDGGNIA